jgi:SAM-dependent methyltransferase
VWCHNRGFAMAFDCSAFLACPDCHHSLQYSSDFLQCTACGKQIPIIRGVPRFVDSDNYAASFGFEWNVHPTTQLDHSGSNLSEITFREKTGFTPEEVKGKLILDVGCGMGRFVDVVARWGARVVGIDLSSAVDAAFQNIGSRENVTILQADAFHLPFRENSFDMIYSIGVLHHTPDCEKAFRSLPRLLKPNGKIALWLYDRSITWGRTAQLYWKFTRRMNPRTLHSLCKLAGPWYYAVRIPVLGKLFWRLLPIDTNPDREWRILDTFDWYSARYRSWHTYGQVHQWFESEGLTDIRHLPVPVSVSGVKI